MQSRWLVAALSCLIVAPPTLADTITVVTSFPSELTNAYKAAYEKKYPNDKVEILNKGTSAADATSYITMDSTDAAINTVYHFQWASC